MNHKKEHIGLGIPESYFLDLEKNILREVETLELEKELKRLLGENHGMTVPEFYFQNFKPAVNPYPIAAKVKSIVAPVIAIAACLVIVINFYSPFTSEIKPLEAQPTFEKLLASTELISDENLELFDLEELSEFMPETILNEEEDLDSMIDFFIDSEEELEDFTYDF